MLPDLKFISRYDNPQKKGIDNIDLKKLNFIFRYKAECQVAAMYHTNAGKMCCLDSSGGELLELR